MPRTKKVPAQPPAPQADLIVSAIVTVICTADGGADVHIKVDLDGRPSLVAAVEPATPKLKIAGAALRRVVLHALSIEMDAPPVDLLAARRTAGRA